MYGVALGISILVNIVCLKGFVMLATDYEIKMQQRYSSMQRAIDHYRKVEYSGFHILMSLKEEVDFIRGKLIEIEEKTHKDRVE